MENIDLPQEAQKYERIRRTDRYKVKENMLDNQINPTTPRVRKPQPQKQQTSTVQRKPQEQKITLRKRIATLILAAGVAIYGGFKILNNENKDEATENNNVMPPKIEELDKASNFRESMSIAKLTNSHTQNSKIAEEVLYSDYTEILINNALNAIPNKNDRAIIITPERQYFDKYSSKFNTELEGTKSGPFSSIEEMVYSYENNPERFATYAKSFMKSFSLDYMKIELAKTYGVDTKDIMITYDVKGKDTYGNISTVTNQRDVIKGDIYEIRVRAKEDGKNKTIENPSFEVLSLTDADAKTIDKLINGTRYSKLREKDWKDFLTIWELDDYNKAEHDLEQYNEDSIKLFSNVISRIANQLEPKANLLEFTWEEEEIER